MKLILIAIGILLFLSCSLNTTFEYDKTKEGAYIELIDSLNQKGYVPYYRGLKKYLQKYDPSVSTDSTFEGIPISESLFLEDSLFYEKSRNSFFNQDIEFLNWLLSFEHDTLTGGNVIRTILWEPYISSVASVAYTSPDDISESIRALELINYYLDGNKNRSSKCGPLVLSCKMSDYESVKTFLKENANSKISQMRKLWVSKK